MDARTCGVCVVSSLVVWAGLAGTPVALAQNTPAAKQAAPAPKEIAPYYVVVNGEKTPLRCAENENAYAIAECAAGQVLRVDAEKSGVLRVVYPPKLTAFVKAEDAAVENSNVKLTKDSKLRAANLASGFAGSWKVLVELPAGTTLKLVEPTLDKDGTLLGYRVTAPAGSRAYVNASAARRATDAEVEAYRTKYGEITSEPLAFIAPAAEPKAITPEPAKPTTPEATPIATAPAPKPGVTNLIEPMAPTGATPEPRPSSVAPAEPTIITQAPTSAELIKAPAMPDKPEQRKRASLKELEETLKTVMAQPAATAEFDALLTEYRRTLDTTPEKDTNVRKAIEQRIKALELKADVHSRVRGLDGERAQVDEAQSRLKDQIAELEKNRTYTTIGRLQSSSVYDGKRLPLMYRLQSVGTPTPRTIGYIRPNEELKLLSKLGQVVGVIGEQQMDQALKVNIINAIRLDVVSDVPAIPPQPEQATPVPVPVPAINPGK